MHGSRHAEGGQVPQTFCGQTEKAIDCAIKMQQHGLSALLHSKPRFIYEQQLPHNYLHILIAPRTIPIIPSITLITASRDAILTMI